MRSLELHFEQISVEQAKKNAQEELSKRPKTEDAQERELGFEHRLLRGTRRYPCRSPGFPRPYHMNDSLSLALQALRDHVLRERDPRTLRELVVQIDSLLDVIEARVKELAENDPSS